MYCNEKIDIVIPWVDGNDPEWIAEKNDMKSIYCGDEKSNSNIRFASWDNLHYWFRAIEQFMPWVNKIFFITWGHIPSFLNINHPKLRIVKHDEYIPSKYLPTYNSGTIEMNVHRILDLSENYIMFNDDCIPIQYIDEEYYFKNNMVCDEAVENIIVASEFGTVGSAARYMQVNNMIIINRHFKKREVQKKNWEKWYCEDYGELLERTKSLSYWNDFPGIHDPHVPVGLKKSILDKIWKLEYRGLDKASKNYFRAYSDINHYLVRYWNLCEGNFYPRRTLGKCFFVDKNNVKQIADVIRYQKEQMICINENCVGEEFEYVKKEINKALEELLPNKSSFEK